MILLFYRIFPSSLVAEKCVKIYFSKWILKTSLAAETAVKPAILFFFVPNGPFWILSVCRWLQGWMITMILWTATSIITARSVIKGGLSHNHRCFLSLWPELWCTCHQVPHLLWTSWSSSSLSLGPVPSCEQQAPTKLLVGLRYRSVRQTDAKSAHFLQKVMYFC